MRHFLMHLSTSFLLLALLLFPTITLRAGTVVYTYDAAGRLTSADYGSGKKLFYQYDKNGNLLAVTTLVKGDVNGDGQVTVGDIFYLINFLFSGGPAPVGSGDANGDGQVTVGDIFYLINFLFSGGPPPV